MVAIATNLAGYNNFDAYVQDNSDTWSYEAAHPDHTILLAGTPRYYTSSVGEAATEGGVTSSEKLFTIGAFQSLVISSAKPWQPYQPVGQIASTFLGGKTQNQAQISRLMVNAPNLLKSLYQSYTNAGPIPEGFNNIITNKYVETTDGNFWINLDNPLFHVPIGLAVVFRSKNYRTLGGLYMELVFIQSFQTQVQMGQAMILENVGLIFDRALPLVFSTQSSTPLGANENYAGF